MANGGGSFFPVTSTVGVEFLLLDDESCVVGREEVDTMSGDYPNMKMFGYRLGVSICIERLGTAAISKSPCCPCCPDIHSLLSVPSTDRR